MWKLIVKFRQVELSDAWSHNRIQGGNQNGLRKRKGYSSG